MSRTNRINDQGADRGCSHSFGSGGPSTNLLVINIKYSCGKQYKNYLMSFKKTISPVDVFGQQHRFESSEQIEEIPLVSKISKSVGN